MKSTIEIKNNFVAFSKILFEKGFFYIFGSNIINKCVSFLGSILLVRIISKAEYGIFTYAWNIYSIIILFNGIGLDASMFQMLCERGSDERKKGIHSFCVKWGLLSDVLIGFIICGIGLWIPLKLDGSNFLIILLFFLPALQLLNNFQQNYLRAEKKNKEFSLLSTINTIIMTVCSVIGAFCFKTVGLIIGYYIAYFVTDVIGALVFDVRSFKTKVEVNPSDRRKLISIAITAIFNNGIAQLLYYIDLFVIGIVISDELIIASYKVATIIPSAFLFIPSALVTFIYPYFAEHIGDSNWCRIVYTKLVTVFGSFNVIISIGLVVFASGIVNVLYGDQYSDAVPIFRLLSLNYFISSTFRIISGNLIASQRRYRFNVIVSIVSGVINIVADYLFISWWGAMGAALATMLVVIVSSVLSTIYLLHVFKHPEDKRFSI